MIRGDTVPMQNGDFELDKNKGPLAEPEAP